MLNNNNGHKTAFVAVAEPSTELLLTSRSVVYPWQCDHMGHMNVMWYAGKFDEATWTLLCHLGITPSYLRANRRAMAAVQQETSYKRELLAGDLITIHSAILEMREKAIRIYRETSRLTRLLQPRSSPECN